MFWQSACQMLSIWDSRSRCKSDRLAKFLEATTTIIEIAAREIALNEGLTGVLERGNGHDFETPLRLRIRNSGKLSAAQTRQQVV